MYIQFNPPPPHLPPLELVIPAGRATAATAEAAIRTHCLRQSEVSYDEDAAVIVAHKAIRMSATLRQCCHRQLQRVAIATLAAQPNPQLQWR